MQATAGQASCINCNAGGSGARWQCCQQTDRLSRYQLISCPLLSSIRSLPGKHRRELWLSLFRPLHCMPDREKKKGPHHIYHDYLHQPTVTCCCSAPSPLQLCFSALMPIRVGLSGPSPGNTHFIELHFVRLGEVGHRTLRVIVSRRCVFRFCRPSSSTPPQRLCSCCPVCTCSSLSDPRLVACRYGPSGGATSGDANSGQCIIW